MKKSNKSVENPLILVPSVADDMGSAIPSFSKSGNVTLSSPNISLNAEHTLAVVPVRSRVGNNPIFGNGKPGDNLTFTDLNSKLGNPWPEPARLHIRHNDLAAEGKSVLVHNSVMEDYDSKVAADFLNTPLTIPSIGSDICSSLNLEKPVLPNVLFPTEDRIDFGNSNINSKINFSNRGGAHVTTFETSSIYPLENSAEVISTDSIRKSLFGGLQTSSIYPLGNSAEVINIDSIRKSLFGGLPGRGSLGGSVTVSDDLIYINNPNPVPCTLKISPGIKVNVGKIGFTVATNNGAFARVPIDDQTSITDGRGDSFTLKLQTSMSVTAVINPTAPLSDSGNSLSGRKFSCFVLKNDAEYNLPGVEDVVPTDIHPLGDSIPEDMI